MYKSGNSVWIQLIGTVLSGDEKAHAGLFEKLKLEQSVICVGRVTPLVKTFDNVTGLVGFKSYLRRLQ